MMMKVGRKKFAFLLAALLVLSMGAVWVGGTFATDVDTSDPAQKNDISNGTDVLSYKVGFDYYDGQNYTSLLPANQPVSNANTSENTFAKDMFFCPGRTEIVYLKVTNNEEFPVKCHVSLNVANTGFDSTLSFAAVNANADLVTGPMPASWDAFVKQAGSQKVLSKGAHALVSDRVLGPRESCYVAVAIHMEEHASNDYMNKSLDMSFSLRIYAKYRTGARPASL